MTGLDFSPAMLERARRKSTTIEWVEGDMLALPFEDASFEAATVGFGVRNVVDLERGVAELRRVLRPGGRLAILEITHPRGILRPFFSLWFDRIVPLLGKVLPGGRAYTYLPASVRRFPGAEELAALLERHGFAQVRFRLMGGTIVALHTAVATAESGDERARDHRVGRRAARLPRRGRGSPRVGRRGAPRHGRRRGRGRARRRREAAAAHAHLPLLARSARSRRSWKASRSSSSTWRR